MKSLATQMLNCHTELKTWTLNLSKLVFFFSPAAPEGSVIKTRPISRCVEGHLLLSRTPGSSAKSSLISEADSDLFLPRPNMCGLFAGLLRARRALAPRPGVMIQQRASYIHGKPPKDNVGPAVSLQNVK